MREGIGKGITTPGAGRLRFKAGTAAIYVALAITMAGVPALSSEVAMWQQNPGPATILGLDRYGGRGVVAFNHDNHTMRPNPDPNAPFKTGKGASCSGCHHTQDPVTGAPQLWKCAGCHRGSGDPKNPKGRDGDEQWSETAYHNLCIGCHVASKKGPVKCGDCHQFREGQR